MAFKQLRSEILWATRQCRQKAAGAEELVEILREALAEAVRVWDEEIEYRAQKSEPPRQEGVAMESLLGALEQLIQRAQQTEPDRPEPALHLTSKQAAAYMGLSVRTVDSWRVTGEGPPFVRIGRSIRYNRAQLDEWIKQRRRRSTSDPGEGQR